MNNTRNVSTHTQIKYHFVFTKLICDQMSVTKLYKGGMNINYLQNFGDNIRIKNK